MRFCSLAIFGLLGLLPIVSAESAGTVACAQLRQPLPQLPLALRSNGGTAVIFIGGFGDEISRIIPHTMAMLPALTPKETRAYYHWHGGNPAEPELGAAQLAERIAQYRQLNPQADLVLIGHSMGATLALRTAAHLNREDGRVFVLTLDPADRSYHPQRAAAVTWWGNAYVINSRSGHDFIAAIGGRWNACREADVNLCFDGRLRDEFGHYYIHDNAFSLLTSSGRGRYISLCNALCRILKTTTPATIPTNDTPRQLLPKEPTDTRR